MALTNGIKKRYLPLIVTILTVVIFIASGTYAWFEWKSTDNPNVTFDANLGIIYNKEHDTLSGTLNPGNSKENGISTTIELWTTTTKTDVYGTLFLNVSQITSPLNTNGMLKWEIWSDSTKLGSGTFDGFTSGDVLEVLKDEILNNTQTFYTIYIWLDDDQINTTDISGGTIVTEIGASAGQLPTSESTLTITNNSSNQDSYVKEYTLNLIATSDLYDIKGYAITNSPDLPTQYTQIATPSTTYNLEYNVTENKKYYVWFRNQNNKVAYEVIDVTCIDRTSPILALDGNVASQFINSSANITIPLKITDTASGINSGTFTASDLTIKTGSTTISPATKNLAYLTSSAGVYKYELSLSGISGNGTLSLTALSGVITDIAGNINDETVLSTNIVIDNTKPTVDNISANKTSDMITVSATASDNLSGVVSYWYSIDGTTYYQSSNANYTFSNVSDGNYTAYVYVKDAAGNTSNVSQVDVIFDNTPPQLASLNVTSSAGTYTSGNTINIEATYSENILNGSGNTFTSTDAPVLSLKFGSGESSNATFVSHSGNKIVYQITVNSSDLGTLQINSYSGTVYDTANNQLNITTPSLGGNTVSASTKAKIDSTYYATLANAIASSGTTKTIQMVNNTAECVVIPSTNTITLDLNGKTITCNTANTSAITNNGTLTVNDTSTGGTITSTYYGIENKGSATLTNGTIKSTSNTSIYNNSTQTNASGTSLYINGASIVSTSGVGINNVSTGTVTIASGSVKGSTSGIYNTTSGTINIGLSTDTLSTETPGVYSTGGSAYGVYMNSGGTLNINNGSIYTANTSVTSAYYKGSCTLTARSDYHITSATATVDGTNYKKSYLVSGVTQIQYQYRNYDSCISRECQGGYVSNSSCGYASCENSNCSCAEWNYTTTCGSWQQGTCEKSGVNLDTTSQCNRQGTSCTAYTSCSAGGQAGSGYYCCDYTRSCSKKRTSCKTYNSCTDSSCGYDTCYDSCATMKCVGGYTSWTSWSPSTLSGYSYCQKRTCNLDAEGVVTSCGSAGSC